jgi:hypothetical protein
MRNGGGEMMILAYVCFFVVYVCGVHQTSGCENTPSLEGQLVWHVVQGNTLRWREDGGEDTAASSECLDFSLQRVERGLAAALQRPCSGWVAHVHSAQHRSTKRPPGMGGRIGAGAPRSRGLRPGCWVGVGLISSN